MNIKCTFQWWKFVDGAGDVADLASSDSGTAFQFYTPVTSDKRILASDVLPCECGEPLRAQLVVMRDFEYVGGESARAASVSAVVAVTVLLVVLLLALLVLLLLLLLVLVSSYPYQSDETISMHEKNDLTHPSPELFIYNRTYWTWS